jgi:hypothetical protein
MFEPKIDYTAFPNSLAATNGPAWSRLKGEWLALSALATSRREVRVAAHGPQLRLADVEALADIEALIRDALGGDEEAMLGFVHTYVVRRRAEVVGHEGQHIGWTDISRAEGQIIMELAANRERLNARFKKEKAALRAASRAAQELLKTLRSA